MERLDAMQKVYHTTCFKCKHCGIKLTKITFCEGDGEPYCKTHYGALFGAQKQFGGLTKTAAAAKCTATAQLATDKAEKAKKEKKAAELKAKKEREAALKAKKEKEAAELKAKKEKEAALKAKRE